MPKARPRKRATSRPGRFARQEVQEGPHVGAGPHASLAARGSIPGPGGSPPGQANRRSGSINVDTVAKTELKIDQDIHQLLASDIAPPGAETVVREADNMLK